MNRFWIILTIVVIGLIGLFVVTKKSTAPSSSSTTDAKIVTSEDHVRGDKSAPVTVIEYGDFQCPACGAFYPIVKSLESTYAGKVRFVFRHFPLSQIHPNALASARAAEAAELQGKFFEMHDKLYETQSVWGELTTNQQALFESYAQELGLNMNKFKEDYASDQVAKIINNDQSSGQQAFSIDSTPTFIVNGNKIKNPEGVEQFSKVLDAEIAKSSSATKK